MKNYIYLKSSISKTKDDSFLYLFYSSRREGRWEKPLVCWKLEKGGGAWASISRRNYLPPAPLEFLHLPTAGIRDVNNAPLTPLQ